MKIYSKILFAVALAYSSAKAQNYTTDEASKNVEKQTPAQSDSKQASYSYNLNFLKAETKQFTISPILTQNQTAYKGNLSGNNFTFKNNETGLALDFQSGVSEKLNFQMSTNYISGKIEKSQNNRKNNFENSGLTDLNFKVKFLESLKSSNFYYDVGLTLSPEKNIISTTKNRGNYYSGGNSFVLKIAQEFILQSENVLGYSLSTDLKSQRKSVYAGTSETEDTTGGNETTASFFYESKLDKNALGAELALTNTASEQVDNNFDGKFETDIKNIGAAKVYGKVAMTESTFYPSLTYSKILNSNLNNFNIQQSENINLTLGVAF
jgi:hypothetical protein